MKGTTKSTMVPLCCSKARRTRSSATNVFPPLVGALHRQPWSGSHSLRAIGLGGVWLKTKVLRQCFKTGPIFSFGHTTSYQLHCAISSTMGWESRLKRYRFKKNTRLRHGRWLSTHIPKKSGDKARFPFWMRLGWNPGDLGSWQGGGKSWTLNEKMLVTTQAIRQGSPTSRNDLILVA